MSALRQVTPAAAVLLAPNPGPMTLDGTNTWVLRAPGETACVVVDPGPLVEEHLAAVAACGPVAEVLLTHGHADHSEGAARLRELTGAPVRALDPAHRLGSEGLGEGDVVAAEGLEVHVLATPGHTSDSLSFVVPRDAAVLTGDTVLGRGTTVVAHPDGRLGPYLEHRRQRLDQVRGALDAGAGTAREVVERVYADVDPVLWPAAELSVRAQLEYLRRS